MTEATLEQARCNMELIEVVEVMKFSAAKNLSDADLTETLKKTIAAERSNIAASIACLIEITARDLHIRLGASSLFVYLTRELKLSESSASKRCAAIRAVRDFPQILPLIQSGRLHLSNISLISRHLTRENAGRLISLAQTQTQRGLEKALAVEFPVAAKRDSVRPVICPSQHGSVALQVADTPRFDNRSDHRRDAVENASHQASEILDGGASESHMEIFALEGAPPQAALGVRVHATLNADAAAALEFLAGAMPGKSASEILSLAVCELRRRRDVASAKPVNRKKAEKNKKCENENENKNETPEREKSDREPSTPSRYISSALRRAVAQRDGYRCSYVAPVKYGADGTGKTALGNSEVRRCEAVHRLEFDHVTPRAFGGQNTAENLRLLCRPHNNLAAKDAMGKEFIESYYGRGQRKGSSGV